MWTAATKQRFLRGELALWRPTGGPPRSLLLVARGLLWSVSLDREVKVGWVQRSALADAERVLPAAWYGDDALVPVDEVPEGLGARLVRAADEVEGLRAGYEAGEQWVPSKDAFLGTYPVLGSLYVAPGSGSVSSRPYPFDTLFGWVWEHPGELPGPLPDGARQRAQALLDPLASLIEDARRGEQAIALGARPDELIFPRGGRFFKLRDLDQGGLDRLLFNPRAAALPLDKVVDLLAWASHRALVPLPPALVASLGRFDDELRRPKAEVIERYLAMLRAGGSVSGGPTTDQTWTIRAAGDGFVIEGYRPFEEGYERTCDPISEERVREMIGSYGLFGLHDEA